MSERIKPKKFRPIKPPIQHFVFPTQREFEYLHELHMLLYIEHNDFYKTISKALPWSHYNPNKPEDVA